MFRSADVFGMGIKICMNLLLQKTKGRDKTGGKVLNQKIAKMDLKDATSENGWNRILEKGRNQVWKRCNHGKKPAKFRYNKKSTEKADKKRIGKSRKKQENSIFFPTEQKPVNRDPNQTSPNKQTKPSQLNQAWNKNRVSQTEAGNQPESKPENHNIPHLAGETHTVNHPEVGHNEQYVVKVWTETVTEDVYDPGLLQCVVRIVMDQADAYGISVCDS